MRSRIDTPCRFYVAIVSILAVPLLLRSFCFLLSFRSSFLLGVRFVLPLQVGPGFGWIVSSFLATFVARCCPLEMSGPGGPSPLWDLKRFCGRLVHSPSGGIREVVFCPLAGGRAFLFRCPCVFFDAQDLTPCAAHLRQLGGDTLGKQHIYPKLSPSVSSPSFCSVFEITLRSNFYNFLFMKVFLLQFFIDAIQGSRTLKVS